MSYFGQAQDGGKPSTSAGSSSPASVASTTSSGAALQGLSASNSVGLTIKRTCDSCAASKVKCSGAQPCTRCQNRGIDCFYRARKKRISTKVRSADAEKRPKDQGEESESTSASVVTILNDLSAQSMHILRPHERRSWVVFFALYKNYIAGCARLWFERQLARLYKRLERTNRPELSQALERWTSDVGIDFDRVRDRYAKCVQIFEDPHSIHSKLANFGWLHLHVDGCVMSSNGHEPTLLTPTEAALRSIETIFGADPSVARLRLRTVGQYPNDIPVVEVNLEYERLFGISQARINELLSDMGSLLLPWGGDMLSFVVPDESDIFAFMQICSINLGFRFTFDKDLKLPVVREAPSAHVIPVMAAGSSRTVPCLLKCLHREWLDTSAVSMEVTMLFQPLSSLAQSEAREPEMTTRNLVASSMPSAQTLSADNVCSSGTSSVPRSEEVIFPDLNIDGGEDDTFVQEILHFARLNDHDR